MGFYLLYDHLDHLLDAVAFAQRAYRAVSAYVKLLEQRASTTAPISTAIAVTWIRPVEGVIHAARMPVDTISVTLDDPSSSRIGKSTMRPCSISRCSAWVTSNSTQRLLTDASDKMISSLS